MRASMMVTEAISRVLAARESGAVERCHVIPHHGVYTNAMHCYNAVSMLLILHPSPSVQLVNALLWHDGGERWCGDMPAFAKDYNPALGEAQESAEQYARRHWGLDDAPFVLSEEERNWLGCVDRLELWVWCHDQYMFGNRHHTRVKANLDNWFKKNMDTMPVPCRMFYEHFEWKRLPDSND